MQRLSLTNTGGYDYNAVETYKAEIGGEVDLYIFSCKKFFYKKVLLE